MKTITVQLDAEVVDKATKPPSWRDIMTMAVETVSVSIETPSAPLLRDPFAATQESYLQKGGDPGANGAGVRLTRSQRRRRLAWPESTAG